jgi:2-oxoglutarate ferredoxin oxidoreductase subunit delta
MPSKVEIQNDRCKGCGLCIEFCPKHSLSLGDELNAIGHQTAQLHNAESCSSCALCALVCPEGGITVHRKRRKKRA